MALSIRLRKKSLNSSSFLLLIIMALRFLAARKSLLSRWWFPQPQTASFCRRGFVVSAAAAFYVRRPFIASRRRRPYLPRSQYSQLSLSSTATAATSLPVPPSSTTSLNQEDEEMIYQELVYLSTELMRHDQLYYENGSPEISDDEYDSLCRREAELCQRYPHLERLWKERGGITRFSRVGSSNSSSNFDSPSLSKEAVKKRTHLRQMLSLDNVHTTDELLKWLERVRKKVTRGESLTILTEPKLDGLSISLRFENGQLLWAATRGDGNRGLDVTEAVLQYIPSLPSGLESSSPIIAPISNSTVLEVRGEVVMPKSAFAELQNENSSLFSNARNAAAGMLLRKQPANSTLPSVDLMFYAYDIVFADEQSTASRDGLEMRHLLQELGFLVPLPIAVTHNLVKDESKEWTANEIQPMLAYSKHLQEHRQRRGGDASEGLDQSSTSSSLSSSSSSYNNYTSWGDYDMDGCVHKVVEASIRQRMGITSRAPRWATAHKLTPTTAITRLVDITTQVGRTGALTPVAVLEPVSLDGAVVQRATLHNFEHLQKLLGNKERIRKRTMVWIRRSGDVIPQVFALVDPMEKQKQYEEDTNGEDTASASSTSDYISLQAPAHCPACGAETVFENLTSRSNSTDAVTSQVLRCGGPALLCPPRAVLAIQHAYSRDALDITGMSEARIRQMMDSGLLKVPSDLFVLVKDDSKLEQLSEMEGWGSLSVNNLKTVTQRVADDGVSLARLLYALSIRSVGVQMASLLANAYGRVDAFWDEVDQAAKSADSSLAFPTLRQDTDVTKGVGPAILSSLVSFAKDDQLTRAGKELSRMVRVLDIPAANDSNETEESLERPWHGQSVVFTGSIPNMSRADAKKLAKEILGAKSTPTGISKSTDWVVLGDKSGKNKDQASHLGVRTIEAKDFVELVDRVRQILSK